MLLRLISTALLLHSSLALCPVGSIQGLSEPSCYKVYAKALSWVEAEGRCRADKGYLISIQDVYTNGFLQNLTGNVDSASTYWTGGSFNSQTQGQWSWVDGAHWYYTNWASGQPVQGPVCLSFGVHDGYWYGEDCSKAKPYLCSVPDTNHRGNPGGGGRTPPPNLPTPPPPDRCPAGWQYLPDTNLCYQVVSSTYSWSSSRTQCQTLGGDLVSVPNFAINAAILTYALNAQLDGSYVAIGLGYNSTSSDSFGWSDGDSGTYRNWYPGYPNDPTSYGCAYMKIGAPGIGTWINSDCYNSYPFVCERESFQF